MSYNVCELWVSESDHVILPLYRLALPRAQASKAGSKAGS